MSVSLLPPAMAHGRAGVRTGAQATVRADRPSFVGAGEQTHWPILARHPRDCTHSSDLTHPRDCTTKRRRPSENTYPFRALIVSHRAAHPRGSERVHVEGSAARNASTCGGRRKCTASPREYCTGTARDCTGLRSSHPPGGDKRWAAKKTWQKKHQAIPFPSLRSQTMRHTVARPRVVQSEACP